MTSTASGTVKVISAAVTPPSASASTTFTSEALDSERTTATMPPSTILLRVSLDSSPSLARVGVRVFKLNPTTCPVYCLGRKCHKACRLLGLSSTPESVGKDVERYFEIHREFNSIELRIAAPRNSPA